ATTKIYTLSLHDALPISADTTCLTRTEASAIDKMWQGPESCAGGVGTCPVPDLAARDLNSGSNKRLWYGMTRGTPLNSLGGVNRSEEHTSELQSLAYLVC